MPSWGRGLGMEDTDYGEYEVRSEETISTTQWSRGKLVTLHQHGALLLPLHQHRGGQGHSPAGACHHLTLNNV